MWQQHSIQLKAKPRGFHLVTKEITSQLTELQHFSVGLAHLFLQHTSASLSLNENADPSVLRDMEQHFNRLAPENPDCFEHSCEGPDDMPAHIKQTLAGSSITLPISNGQLNMGIWQGIYLGEHRNHAGSRSIIVTLNGE